jgi:hypothetical protein
MHAWYFMLLSMEYFNEFLDLLYVNWALPLWAIIHRSQAPVRAYAQEQGPCAV